MFGIDLTNLRVLLSSTFTTFLEKQHVQADAAIEQMINLSLELFKLK